MYFCLSLADFGLDRKIESWKLIIFCAALLFKVVSQDGDMLDELCLPVRTPLPIPPGGGKKTFIKPSTSVVIPGNRPW